jgi:hypothetical protein
VHGCEGSISSAVVTGATGAGTWLIGLAFAMGGPRITTYA